MNTAALHGLKHGNDEVRVLITGSAGKIGRQLVAELSDSHELVLVDRVRQSDPRAVRANLARGRIHSSRRWLRGLVWRPAWDRSFTGVDVVVHLAAQSFPNQGWRWIRPNNMDATWNVLQACVRERVPRVVFASTYRLTLSRQRQMAPHCYKPDGPKLGTQEPPHAATPYTASKALGEAIGRGLVTDGLLESFIAVRIGACDRDPPGDERGPVWLGLDDARSLLRRCIESDFRGFHVVYGMSAQPDVPYDLEPGRQLLGWSPSQRAP